MIHLNDHRISLLAQNKAFKSKITGDESETFPFTKYRSNYRKYSACHSDYLGLKHAIH